MSLFVSVSFEFSGTEAKADKIITTLRDYLKNEGAREILMTHSGEADDKEAEPTTGRRR